jgi:hypothetical protein
MDRGTTLKGITPKGTIRKDITGRDTTRAIIPMSFPALLDWTMPECVNVLLQAKFANV